MGKKKDAEKKAKTRIDKVTGEELPAGWAGFMRFLKDQKISYSDVAMIFGMIGLLVFLYLFQMSFSDALSATTEISYGYIAKEDEQGLYYVVDDGHNRLLCFNLDGNIVSTLSGATAGEGGTLYIDDFAAADGLTYLSASEWDGMLLSREVIAVYNGERYVRTIAERDYSEMAVNKHRFYGVSVRDGVLSYAETEDNAIVLHHITLADGTEKTQNAFFDNAFNAVSDCAFDGELAYVLDKKGNITAIGDDVRTTVYSTALEGEENRVPYRLSVSKSGEICVTDIRDGQILKIDRETKHAQVILENVSSLTATYTADGTGILYLEDDGLRVNQGGETTTYLELQKTTLQIILQAVWFAAWLLFTFDTLLVLLRVVLGLARRKQSAAKKVSFLVIGVVALVSLILCGMLINNFSGIYRERLMDQIESSAMIMANQVPEGTVEQLNRMEDFDNEAYQAICDVMEKVFTYELDFNKQLYCNILRLADDGETAFAVAYRDQSIGVFFPLDEVETAEVIEAYRDENGGRPLWNSSVSDVSGTYLSVKVPIYEYGKVTGVVAVGSETYVIQDMITRLQTQILLSIAVILMLIWLAISEGMAWFTNKERYQGNRNTGRLDALPGHLIRILVFAVFACYNMTATFLPVWILRNSTIFAEANRDFMASLPITVNIFVIGVMSLFTAAGVRRLGIGRILTISTICSLCGNLVMFLFPSYVSVCAGLLIDGIGVGLITNATYVLLTYVKNEDDQQWGFTVYNTAYLAGMNFGMLLGSLLAVLLGQRIVFVVVAVVWLCLMLTGNLMIRQLQGVLSKDQEETAAKPEKSGISTTRFLFNKPVLSFIVLIQNPYIVFNSFVFYFVPLFCGNMGYDETIVSMLIMLYSEIAVLTGDMLTQRISKAIGHRGIYMALVTNILALMVFALLRNMLGVVLALLMLGMAAAYGKPMQQTWFLKQKQVQQYGEDRAMGVYNFSENIGESMGPIVFARLMAQSPLLGAVSSFCGAVLALGSGHFILNRKGMKEKD